MTCETGTSKQQQTPAAHSKRYIAKHSIRSTTGTSNNNDSNSCTNTSTKQRTNVAANRRKRQLKRNNTYL
jgi:hypothetical protein